MAAVGEEGRKDLQEEKKLALVTVLGYKKITRSV